MQLNSYQYLSLLWLIFWLMQAGNNELSGWHVLWIIQRSRTLGTSIANIVDFLYGILIYAVNLFLWLFWLFKMVTMSPLEWYFPRIVSNANTIYLWDQHRKETVLGFFMVHLSHFLFLKSFWEFQLPYLFFCYCYYHYLSYYYYCCRHCYNCYVFKPTITFTQRTSQPPTTNAFYHPTTSGERKQLVVLSEHLLR